MKQHIISTRAFTLVELLVVITILAIISITAYTSFSGSTDKAKNSTKIGHIASIETGLNTFFVEKNYYPMPSVYSATNVWGYSGTTTVTVVAKPTCTFTGAKNVDQILSVSGSLIVGGGQVFESGGTNQIGAKGVIDSSVLGKQYLSQELMDPTLKDTKVGDTETFADYGIGKYVYAIYSKPAAIASWNSGEKRGQAYNLAITVADAGKIAVTKISGNFDKSLCTKCSDSLIGSGTTSLVDGNYYTGSAVSDSNITIPYPISGF